MKARLWLALPALVALCTPLAAEATGRDMPSDPFPALAAAPLVYALVLNPLGARTWAERELEAVRIGAHGDLREEMDSRTSFILLALLTPSSPAYALEMMEAPREPEPEPARAGAATPDPVLQDAFAAMGLTLADVAGTPEVPTAAFTIAEAILGLLNWGLERNTELVRARGGAALRIDPAVRDARPEHLRFLKPSAGPKPVPLLVGKKIVQSVYKMLLGVAIGVLIWAFVRGPA
jgi:hypothetical protein